MRIGIIALLFIGFTQVVFAQISGPAIRTSISLNEKTLADGDVVDIYSFKDLRIDVNKTAEDLYDEFELQFTVVPYNMEILVFNQKPSELPILNIDEMLSYRSIEKDQISHVILSVRYKEIANSTITIFTHTVETAEEHFQEFVSHAGAGNAENATWHLEQAIKLDPDNHDYTFSQAQFYWEIGESATAFRLFDAILETHPTYEVLNYLGYIYISQRELKKAEELYLRAMDYTENDEQKSDAHTSLGNVERLRYNYPKAYEYYKTALSFNPKNIGALNNIVSVCDEVNKAEEKVVYFQRIIDADSSFYLVHVNIGFHYLGEEKYQEALEEFEAVLKIDSTEALTLNNKSYALLKLKRLDEALIFVNKSLSYLPKNSYAFRNRALIKLEMGQKSSACEDLVMAKELKFTEEYGSEVVDLIEKHCQ